MHDLFQRLKRRHEFWLASVIAVLVVYLSIATQGFLTLQNLFDLLTSYAFLGILAAGLLVVLISGGIDISFTATASIAQYVTMLLANKYGLNWFLVFALAIGIQFLLITFYAHFGEGFKDFAWNRQGGGWEYPLFWGLIWVAIGLRGGGPYSLDRKLGREF